MHTTIINILLGPRKRVKICDNLDEVILVVTAKWVGCHTYFYEAHNVSAMPDLFTHQYKGNANKQRPYKIMINE